jgi:hypothetical protein
MTRDEAVELFGKMEGRGTSCLGEDLTDWAVAVGILKMDDPQIEGVTDEKLEDQFKRDGFFRRTEIDYVFNVLDELNLKIIEK